MSHPASGAGGDVMKVSTTSSQTDETNASQSTVITVRLYGSASNSEIGPNGLLRTRSEPVPGHGPQKPVQDTLITDVVVIRHPRSVLILAVLELIIGLQILVIGLICVIYNAPIYASGVWAAWLFIAQGILGIVMVKKYPIRRLVVCLLIITVIGLIVALILFAITWHELKVQEERMRRDGWDFVQQSTMELNKIVESTKAAVFIIQLVLLAAEASACIVTLLFCILNVQQPSKEVRRAFYIADDQFGHQLVLVPVKLRTGANMDTWLDEAAAAASSATLGGMQPGGGILSGYSSTISTYPQYSSLNRPLHHQRLNGVTFSAVKASKAVQTNVTFGQ